MSGDFLMRGVPAARPSRRLVAIAPCLAIIAIHGHGAANSAGMPERGGVRPPLSVVVAETQVIQPVDAGVAFTGAGLAVSGDLMLVGVPGTTNGAPGAVYAFRFVAGAWAALTAPTLMHHGDTTSNFGRAIALSGTTAVVGAPNDGTGTGGPGSAWRYEFDGTAWDDGVEIEAPAGTPNEFGTAVAISGDRIAIGAPHTGTNMAIDGGVVIYGPGEPAGTLIRASASREADAITRASDDLFGSSVALDGDTLLVGAPSNDDVIAEAGAAYAFHADDGWTERFIFLPTAMFRQRYGTSVALGGGGTIAAVGAPEAGERLSDNRGAVFIRVRGSDGDPWPAADEPLEAEDDAPSTYFGHSLAIDGSRLLVGAPLRDGPMRDTGGAYLFERRDEAWIATARFQATGLETGSRLGERVALSGDRIAVAATEGPMMGQNIGLVATFAPPAMLGTVCAIDGACESGFCTDGVCCEARCDGDCLACGTGGSCEAADEGMACTSACGAGTCGAGECSSIDDCDAGTDTGPADAGDTGVGRVTRVSGCKCAVGADRPSSAAILVPLTLALTLLWRARRR